MRQVPARGSRIEMGSDPAVLGRVRRLIVVSAVALGLIWALAVVTLDAAWPIDLALAAGWVAMPALLGLSLSRPRVRRLLAVPATLVGGALVAACLTALPAGPARAGWPAVAAGVLVGAGLGSWFWYRWLPVPRRLDEPFAPGRWILVGLHVAPILAGLTLVSIAAFG